jgi:helix-turn-helix protein
MIFSRKTSCPDTPFQGGERGRKTPPPVVTMLLTVKDLSTWLNIKPSTLYLWTSQDKIPCRKIHGLIRFERDAILSWLDSFAGEPSNPACHIPGHNTSATVDDLIARAKREVYTSGHGETIAPSPTGKE